jgi:hypothetical protein
MVGASDVSARLTCCRFRGDEGGEALLGEGSCGPLGVEVEPTRCECCCTWPEMLIRYLGRAEECASPARCVDASRCGAIPRTTRTIQVRVPQPVARGVALHSAVTLAGLPIGHVSDLEPEDEVVLVTLLVRDDIPIRPDGYLTSKGPHLEIDPGTPAERDPATESDARASSLPYLSSEEELLRRIETVED